MTHCGKSHTNHHWLPWHTVARLTPTTTGCHDTLWQASHQPPMAAMAHCGKSHTNHHWLPWHTVASHTPTTNGCHDTLWQASHQPPMAAMTHCGKSHTNHQWLPWHTVASHTPTTNGCLDTLWQASQWHCRRLANDAGSAGSQPGTWRANRGACAAPDMHDQLELTTYTLIHGCNCDWSENSRLCLSCQLITGFLNIVVSQIANKCVDMIL